MESMVFNTNMNYYRLRKLCQYDIDSINVVLTFDYFVGGF